MESESHRRMTTVRQSARHLSTVPMFPWQLIAKESDDSLNGIVLAESVCIYVPGERKTWDATYSVNLINYSGKRSSYLFPFLQLFLYGAQNAKPDISQARKAF